MTKRWIVASSAPDDFRARFPERSPTALQLLWNRGLREERQIDEFLDPDYAKDLHDPFLFRDMRRAVDRLIAAIAAREKIVVHGDYDADGVCAATLLSTTLRRLGATVEVFLPHRELDGYGLNVRNAERFAAEGAKVVVTCDCGIANTEEIAIATAKGVDVIVTDHHAMPAELPKAYAIIHPKVPGETYPWEGLAGGGVAFKLAQALLRERGARSEEPGEKIPAGFEKWLLDLVAISSVADMVPLLGETRTLVKYGLIVLAKTKRVGLRALMKAAGVLDADGAPRRAVDATAIGFQIAPRINAAGRLDHASAAYALLAEEDPVRAEELARGLHEANAERQRLTEICVNEARAQILANGWDKDPAIVVAGDWPPGLVGLVAGRLMDEFYRPVFAVSLRDRCVGSGRSIPEYHVVEAMKTFAEVFEKFGGHPQACGFTVKPGMTDELRTRLVAHAKEVFAEKELLPTLAIDAEMALEAVDWAFHDAVRLFEPFGVGNPEPCFLARDLRVLEAQPVGAEGKHLRLTVAHWSGERRKMIAFGFGPNGRNAPGARSQEPGETMHSGDRIDAVFTVGANQWNGTRELQLKVVDLRKSDDGSQ